MKKVYNLDKWQLNKDIPHAKTSVDVSIYLQYPDPLQFIEFKPKDRINKIDLFHEESLTKLLLLNLFNDYEIIGTKKRPRSVKTTIKLSKLKTLDKLDYINSISIENIEHATNIIVEEKLIDKYFCVKMTAVIEIEGLLTKKQSIEKRFVLIKANSFDDAYEKLEQQKDKYTVTYLNSDGRFVRWRIDSFNDCYETDILSPNDLENPAGIEIYSELKSRKNKMKTVWDGKF